MSFSEQSAQSALQVRRTGAIALTVSDLERSILFYTQALAFEQISDVTVIDQADGKPQRSSGARVRIAKLRLGAEQIELMQYLDIESQPIPPDSRSNDLWFQHFAVVVSDMDAAYAHLQTCPIKPISTAPQTFPSGNLASAHIRAFKFKDPDCHNLEIIWFPPDKGQDKWHQATDRLFLGIDHSAIAIANTEASIRFYRDLLGMPVEQQSVNWRAVQARLDDLPDAVVEVTSLRPDQATIGVEMLAYIQPDQGRPRAAAWQRSDIPYMHIQLFVTDLKAALVELQTCTVEFNSLKWVDAVNSSLYCWGTLIKDPDGHALLLVA